MPSAVSACRLDSVLHINQVDNNDRPIDRANRAERKLSAFSLNGFHMFVTRSINHVSYFRRFFAHAATKFLQLMIEI